MIILVDEEEDLWRRAGDWIEKESSKLPKSGRKMKQYLIDFLILMFGEDSIDYTSIEILKTSVNLQIEYTLRVSPNGMRQVAEGVNLLQPSKNFVTLIYYDDIEEHHLVRRID